MKEKTQTISSLVENYIKTKPFLLTALSQGIVNLTSLARIICKEIQGKVDKEVQNGAIVMALRRLSSEMEFRATHRIIKVLREIEEIAVRANLSSYTYLMSETLLSKQAVFLSEIQSNKDIFYTSSYGVSETSIIVSNAIEQLLETSLVDEKLLYKIKNLSSISVKLPKENISIPGVYYFIFQRLAWEGINVSEVISTANEFTIVLPEESVDLAFKVIKDLKRV